MRKVAYRSTAAVLAVLVIAGCSTERTKKSAGGTTDTLVMTASNAAPSFVQNWNVESPVQQKGPAATLFYEPLIRVDTLHGNKAKPWLASSWEYSDGNKTLTFHLRDDVTWSDGKKFTSDDVKFTLEVPVKQKSLGLAPEGFTSIDTPDAKTVVLHYPTPQFHTLLDFSNIVMLPERLWSKQDLSKWTNPEPVGTGPYTLEKFSPQQIKLKVRSDYWGGKFHGVKHVDIRAFSSVQTAQELLLKNQLTWSTLALQDPEKNFEQQDPDHNKYWGYPLGGSEGLLFNQAKSPTNDVNVRRALYAAADPEKLKAVFDNGQESANETGLNPKVWGSWIAPELQGRTHKPDIAAAKAALKAGGYTIVKGNLTKGGKSYPLSITAISEYTNWAAWADGLAAQWQDALGLHVAVKKLTATVEAEQEAVGNYDIIFDFLVGANDIWSTLKTQIDSTDLPPLGKSASTDLARYDNPQVNQWLAQMAGTDDQAKLKELAYKVERQAVKDVAYAPLDASSQFMEVNDTDWTGWPDPANADYIPHTLRGPDTTLTVMNLKPAK